MIDQRRKPEQPGAAEQRALMTDPNIDGRPIRIWRTSIGRAFASVLALVLAISVGLLAIADETEAASIAYCASGNAGAHELLNASLLQQHSDAPVVVRTGETEPDGCGAFPFVPDGYPIMIVVWSDDGFSTGSTGWLDADASAGILTIQLASQATPRID